MVRQKDFEVFSIELPKLRPGINSFEFEVGENFFKLFEQPLIKNGKVQVSVEIKKNLDHLDARFKFNGEVDLNCDRCDKIYVQPVSTEKRIIYAYSEGEFEEGNQEEVIYIGREIFLLNLSQEMYDYICLEMPIRKVPENCGPECPKDFDNGSGFQNTSSEEPDPRWLVLKKLKEENK